MRARLVHWHSDQAHLQFALHRSLALDAFCSPEEQIAFSENAHVDDNYT